MGFPAFPAVSAGMFPILIINTALYIAALKNICKSLLRTVGIGRGSLDVLQPQLHPVDDAGSPGSGGLISSLILPTMWDEIRLSLPQGKYDPAVHVGGEGDGDEEEEGTQCAVCLSKLVGGTDILELPRCRHIFHQLCVDEWLAHRQATCPVCRASLISDELSRRYRRREEELTEELVLWFSSSFHGSGLQGL